MNEITNTIPEVINIANEFGQLAKGEIDKEKVEGFLEGLIGEYGWLLLIAIVTIMARDMIMNFAQGILVFMGNNFNNDDIIYISGRQARIVRVGIRNTVFYMTDRRTKMLVPNEQLKLLTIEKRLPKNPRSPVYFCKGPYVRVAILARSFMFLPVSLLRSLACFLSAICNAAL